MRQLRTTWLTVLMGWATMASPAFGALPSGFIEENIPRPDGAAQWNGVVGVRFLGNGRMFAWERDGRVWIVDAQNPVTQPFLDISPEVGGWRDHGMLGFALHPNFVNNGYVYVLYVVDRHHLMNCNSSQPGPPVCNGTYNPATNDYFTATIGRITRYRAVMPLGDSDYARATSVDYSSRKVLLGETRQTGCPILYESHSVGSIIFGQDGTLLAACGDGASYNVMDPGSISHTYYSQALTDGIISTKENVGSFRSQLVDSLGGKVWRLDPETGNGVASNPFFDAANPRAAKSRVWALGVRNPYRMTLRPNSGSHDPDDANPGSIFLGDVGWTAWEDLHVIRSGGENLGWPLYEGMAANSSYVSGSPFNLDAPNPLAGGGCPANLRFRDLLVQDTLATPSFPNPCNASQQLPATLDLFVHSRPKIDWQHGSNNARWPAFNGTVAENPQVGQSNTQGTYTVTGTPFGGATSTAGTWYSGDQFPATYKNTYFHADYSSQWIRNFVFDTNDFPVAVRTFGDSLGGVVSIAEQPVDGSLYYIAWATFVRKITYVGTGNRAPKAVVSANVTYGSSPLTVQLSGAGSSDPDGQALTYSWDFGDGSPAGSGQVVNHTFTAPGAGPASFTVTLTVRDTANATGQATIVVSPNNTPPEAYIVVPPNGYAYATDSNTAIDLTAVLYDTETGPGSLTCRWLNVLHHNEHTHEDSVINACSGTTVITPLGCGAELYYFEMQLEVTDPQGLVTKRSSFVYPRCDGNPPPVALDDSATAVAGGSATVNVLANDTDNTGLNTATVEIIAPPAHGTATVLGTGSVLYQNGGGTLPDAFHYTVRDIAGSISNAARVSIAAGVVDTTSPTIPQGLIASAVSATQVNLAWSASTDTGTGVAGYRVFRNGTAIATTTSTSYSNTGLTANTAYTYTVSAYDGAVPPNESAQSAGSSVTTPPASDTTPPTVPQGLNASAVSSTQVNLTWSASTDTGTGVAGYRVFRNGTAVATTTATSYSNTGLTPSTPYTYTVSAYDGAVPPNESVQSTSSTATTLSSGGGGTVIRVNAAGPAFTDSLGQAWQADTGFNTGSAGGFGAIAIANTVEDTLYQTERWDPAAAPELTYSFTVPNGTYLVRLHFSENYWATQSNGARVFDVNIEGTLVHDNVDVYQQAGGGQRALIKTATVTVNDGQINIQLVHQTENPIINALEVVQQGGGAPDTTPPTVPTGLATTSVTATQVVLTWSASTDAGTGVAGYRVSRNGTAIGTSTATSYTDSGVQPNTAYTYTVSAYDGASPPNESLGSSPLNVTTPAAGDTTPPSVPAGLTATPVSPNRIDLAWTASTDTGTGVAGYRIWRNGTNVGSTTSTSFADVGLSPSTLYTYRVSAFDAATPPNESSQSAQVSASTPTAPDTTPPSVPAGLTASALNATQISLVWSASTDSGTGVAGYRIYRGGVQVGSTSSTSYVDSGLAPSTPYTYRVSAYDGAVPPNESAQSTSATATTQAVGGGGTVIRVNAAGPAFTDSLGQAWQADTGFNTGNTGSFGTIAIANTIEDALYRTERWDPAAAPELMYSFTVPNGTYLVRLHFSENYWAAQTNGARVFDVNIEGALVHDNVDVYQQAGGGQRALIKTATVVVNDGQINIQFVHQTENPIINALEIVQQATVPTNYPPVATFTASTVRGLAPLSVSFDGSTSNDPDGTITAYAWDFGDRTSGNTPTATHVYASPGLHVVTLTVTDDDGATDISDPVTIEVLDVVQNQAPVVSGGPDRSGVAGQMIHLDGTATDDGLPIPPGALTVGWSVLSGPGTPTWPLNDQFSAHAHPVFAVAGAYVLRVTATDGALTSTDDVSVTVSAADTTAPTIPQGVAAVAASATQVNVTWSASTDTGTGVAGYRVFRNGVSVGTTAATSFANTGLTPNTSYTYTVSAFDGATPANESVQSAGSSVTTPPASDTTPPTVPQSLNAVAASATQVNLTWSGSTDTGTGVAGYRVFRNGSSIATTTGTSYSDTGLVASTQYTYAVSAYDGATPPNESAQSTSSTATTLSSGGGGTLIRVNAAGPAFTDTLGQVWQADTGYNTGNTGSFGTIAIANTVEDTLYRTERWDPAAAPELMYSFTVPNGTYLVRLHFSENYWAAQSVGARVFDVNIEGVLAHDNVDVFQQAGGGQRALIKTATVVVNDGQINIQLVHQTENPIINALEIIQQ